MPFLVSRTCTRNSGCSDEESHPLKYYRNLSAYVLLGDSGAGKSEAFKQEAKESGGKYFTARDFITLEPEARGFGQPWFIDALDEVRVGVQNGREPLDLIRKHLKKIGSPPFRLSCREADWWGENDTRALKEISQNKNLVLLHLDPLRDEDVEAILLHKLVLHDPLNFLKMAHKHSLGGLLYNPQVLNLLVDAVGNNDSWPQSRKEIYEMACQKLVDEQNSEHSHVQFNKVCSVDSMLEAAGHLCAVQLLSGISGFASNKCGVDDQHVGLNELPEYNSLFPLVLKTNLFKHNAEEQRVPIHRSVAEYLAAYYLGKLIGRSSLPLPFGRVLALMPDEAGVVSSNLRGLSAWLSVHCLPGRRILIERDPLGVVLYGDVRDFPIEDKELIVEAFRNKAQHDDWFHFEEHAFGALGTTNMEEAFSMFLSSSSRKNVHQKVLKIVLDAILYGDSMPNLSDMLENIARDSSYWPLIRTSALQILLRDQDNFLRLWQLAKDICFNIVKDRNDEILGLLLSELYPKVITPLEILDYLHLPKDHNLVGCYLNFWNNRFLDLIPSNDLPLILGECVRRGNQMQQISYEHRVDHWIAKLLGSGLELHGDNLSAKDLYIWLDLLQYTQYQEEDSGMISRWLSTRFEKYKAMIEYNAAKLRQEYL